MRINIYKFILSIMIFLTPLLASEVFYLNTKSMCKWDLTSDQVSKKVSSEVKITLIKLPAAQIKGYDNQILTHITSLDSENNGKVSIFYQKSDTCYRDFLFLDNKLSVISCRYDKLSREEFTSLFADLKRSYGSPDTQRDETTITHSFVKKGTKVLFMVRGSGTSFRARIYFYTDELFRRALSL